MQALTEETAKMLSPASISSNDYLYITLSKCTRKFIVWVKATSPFRLLKLREAICLCETENSFEDIGYLNALKGNLTRAENDLNYRGDNLQHLVGKYGGRLDGFVRGAVEQLKVNVAPSSNAKYEFISRIPERKQLSESNQWELAATDLTSIVINALWDRKQLMFEDDARLVYEYLLLTWKQGEVNARRVAEYEKDKIIPKHNYTLHPEFTLSGYQQLALVNSMTSEGYAAFMKMGTGKTAVLLAKVCNQATALDRVYRCIVVCPKNVRMNWETEMQRFATCSGRVTVLRGTPLQRRKGLIDAFTLNETHQFTMVVVSYDTLCSSTWEDLQHIPWDLAIADESHYFKNPTTKRYKQMMKLRDIATSRQPLTGTPVTNTPLDLFAQLEFMSKGNSGFMNYKNFKNFHGNYQKGESGHDILVSAKNTAFLKERLARFSYQITLEEAQPDLPGKVYDVFEVEMTKKQSELYEQLKKELSIEIENELKSDRPKSMVATCILTKLLRLAQITSGFAVWDAEYNEEGDILHPKTIENIDELNPKLEAITELAKDKTKHQKSIIWACFRHDITSITKHLQELGHDPVTYYGGTSDKDRIISERRFNCDPECRWMVGNPGAGGTGLNLLGYDYSNITDNSLAKETYCDHSIYYSIDWSMTKREQSEARPHRRGVKRTVRVTDICVPNSIDTELRKRVLGKIQNAKELQDISDLLQTVLGV